METAESDVGYLAKIDEHLAKLQETRFIVSRTLCTWGLSC